MRWGEEVRQKRVRQLGLTFERVRIACFVLGCVLWRRASGLWTVDALEGEGEGHLQTGRSVGHAGAVLRGLKKDMPRALLPL